MNAKQYEKTLDEQFDIGGITVIVCYMPTGWYAEDINNETMICQAQPDKKTAIAKVEKYTGAKYDPKMSKFL